MNQESKSEKQDKLYKTGKNDWKNDINNNNSLITNSSTSMRSYDSGSPSSSDRRRKNNTQYVWDQIDEPPAAPPSNNTRIWDIDKGYIKETHKDYISKASDLEEDSLWSLRTDSKLIKTGAELDTNDNSTCFSISSSYVENNKNRLDKKSNNSVMKDSSINLENRSVNSVDTSNLQTIVAEITSKVESMKNELKLKSKHVSELQSDLVRIQNAKQRRATKFSNNWNQKLKDLENEQKEGIDKQKVFLVRLEEDTKKLQLKKDMLKDKIRSIKKNMDVTMKGRHEDCRRKRIQSMRQLEHDEKKTFEKIANQKSEIMNKQAADSFGLVIDKMVLNNKEYLRTRSSEIETNNLQLKYKLKEDIENRILKGIDDIKDMFNDDDEKSKRNGEKRFEDLLRKNSDELSAVKERFSRQGKLLEESSERTRHLDAETTLEALRSLRKTEINHTEELISSNQLSMSNLNQKFTTEILELQEKLSLEERNFTEQCEVIKLKKRDDRGNKEKVQLIAKSSNETEKLIIRVREEIIEERKKMKKNIENEVIELRLQIQSRLDSINETEKKSLLKCKDYRENIDNSRIQLQKFQEEYEIKNKSLVLLKERLTHLRNSLRNIEDNVDVSDQRRNNEIIEKRTKMTSEIEKWLSKENNLEISIANQELQYKKKKDKINNENLDELDRIKDKISILLNRKDGNIRDLNRQLKELNERSSSIQIEIERFREGKFGAISEIDNNLSQINISNLDKYNNETNSNNKKSSKSNAKLWV
jgi:hypothetical protein